MKRGVSLYYAALNNAAYNGMQVNAMVLTYYDLLASCDFGHLPENHFRCRGLQFRQNFSGKVELYL
jgi:hypothetical protein